MPDPRLPALGRRWIQTWAPAEAGAQTREAQQLALQARTGLLPSQEHRWRKHRLRLGVCEGHTELGDLLWLECNAAELNGVSFTKGCFVGQENTARMNWRQKVNRRLFVVSGDVPNARVHYPDLGLSVAHARVDSAPTDTILPEWLAESLAR